MDVAYVPISVDTVDIVKRVRSLKICLQHLYSAYLVLTGKSSISRSLRLVELSWLEGIS